MRQHSAQHAEKKAVMLCLPIGVADATLGAYMFELSKGKHLWAPADTKGLNTSIVGTIVTTLIEIPAATTRLCINAMFCNSS